MQYWFWKSDKYVSGYPLYLNENATSENSEVWSAMTPRFVIIATLYTWKISNVHVPLAKLRCTLDNLCDRASDSVRWSMLHIIWSISYGPHHMNHIISIILLHLIWFGLKWYKLYPIIHIVIGKSQKRGFLKKWLLEWIACFIPSGNTIHREIKSNRSSPNWLNHVVHSRSHFSRSHFIWLLSTTSYDKIKSYWKPNFRKHRMFHADVMMNAPKDRTLFNYSPKHGWPMLR